MFDLERSESEFKKALAINTDFIQPQIHLGQIALYRGNLAQAMDYFITVLGTDPGNTESNLLAGYMMWKQGNESRALEYFTKAYNRAAKELSDHAGSNEGDTAEGRSLERHINQSLFQPFFTDLAHLPGKNLSEEMLSLFKSIDVFL